MYLVTRVKAGQMSVRDMLKLQLGVRSCKWMALIARNLAVHPGTYRADLAHQQLHLPERWGWEIEIS